MVIIRMWYNNATPVVIYNSITINFVAMRIIPAISANFWNSTASNKDAMEVVCNVVPIDNASEAAVADGLQVIPVKNLREAVDFFSGENEIVPFKIDISECYII